MRESRLISIGVLSLGFIPLGVVGIAGKLSLE